MFMTAVEAKARALNNQHKEYNNILLKIGELIQEACCNKAYYIKYSIDDGSIRTMVRNELKELGYDISVECSNILKISWEEGLWGVIPLDFERYKTLIDNGG